MKAQNYGLLFFTFFAIFPAYRNVGLFFYVSGTISVEFRAAMGGYFARRTVSAYSDFDLHLSKFGRGKHLVYRASGRADFGLLRWRT